MDRLPQRLTAFFYLCKYILFLLHFIQVYIRSLLQKVYIQPYSFMSFFFLLSGNMKIKPPCHWGWLLNHLGVFTIDLVGAWCIALISWSTPEQTGLDW